MDPLLNELFDEAIKIELNVAALYLLFHRKLEEDAVFWWELALEEQNHAALLKAAREMTKTDRVELPKDLLPDNVDSLKASNKLVVQLEEEFEETPSRYLAFQLALRIEQSSGELHYDQFMHQAADSKISKIFLKLNGEDKDHAKRIEEYMKKHHIPFE